MCQARFRPKIPAAMQMNSGETNGNGAKATEQQPPASLPQTPPGAATSTNGTCNATTSSDNSMLHVKRSRYLREADRRNIIFRIDRGEKQAALAKEFGVTRAAICHINKNRAEILSRSERADVQLSARHPKRSYYGAMRSATHTPSPDHSQNTSDDALHEAPRVMEIRSRAMLILLTFMRRHDTSSRDFRHYTNRAIRMILEEALAFAPSSRVEIRTASNYTCKGYVLNSPSCAIAIGESGFPLLEQYQKLEPESSTGYVTMRYGTNSNGDNVLYTQEICTPANLSSSMIFLLDATCATGTRAITTINALLELGAKQERIIFVTIAASAPGVAVICGAFPNVKIATGVMEPDVDQARGLCPGLGNFVERFFNTTTSAYARTSPSIQEVTYSL